MTDVALIKAESFSKEKLSWAAAIFWSRAVLIPADEKTSKERREALTPLVDILNHRPGYLSNLEIHAPFTRQITVTTLTAAAAVAPAAAVDTAPPPGPPSRGVSIRYFSGRAVHCGEQIFLNYGVRSNQELLAYFGFTLSGNEGDTATVFTSPPSIGDSGYLMYKDVLPVSLLDSVRWKRDYSSNSSSDDDLTADRAAPTEQVYNIPSAGASDSGGGGTAAWFANFLRSESLSGGDDGPKVDFANVGTVRGSVEKERAALDDFDELLQREVKCYRAVLARSNLRAVKEDEEEEGTSADWKRAFAADVCRYAAGTIEVLISVLALSAQLRGALKTKTEQQQKQ